MARPHAVAISLSEADRTVLQNWARRRKTAQALALRARIPRGTRMNMEGRNPLPSGMG